MEASGIHIVILCSRLDLPGGIERAVVNTANLFESKGHRVSILILDETSESFYPVNNGVHVHQLAVSFGITAAGNPVSRKIRLLSDVLKLRKALKSLHPTIVISTEYPFAAAMVLCGIRKKCKLVSWEHHHMNELEKNAFWDRVFRFTYPRLHQIVCLNSDEEILFEPLNEEVTVIPNFVSEQNTLADHSNPRILTVARLNFVKGIDILVSVAQRVLLRHPGWTWKIIGQGRMDAEYIEQIESAGLEERLIIQQPTGHDLSREYSSSSVYVMTSRNECFPMTLLEAMSHGLPCVAFDCETGPRHMIQNEQNGYLIPPGDLDSMTLKITELIENAEKRKLMGKNAIDSMKEFSEEKIYERWNKNVLT